MNPYTTPTEARIQPRDIARIMRTNLYTAAPALAVLERTRSWQAEAELERLMKQNGVPVKSPFSLLRQTIGTTLIHTGERLTGLPGAAASHKMAIATRGLRPAGR